MQHLIKLIKSLYDNNSVQVRVEGELTDAFKTAKGMRQGCILSSTLFNAYSEWMLREATNDWFGGISIGVKKLSNLRYADDTTLLAESEEELIQLIEIIKRISKEAGLRINRAKTKVMVVNRAKTARNSNPNIQGLEVVNSFVYLRTTITDRGGSMEEIKRRAAIVKTAVFKLTKIWKSRDVTKRTKLRILCTLVFSIFLYASECWTIKKTDADKINAFEMYCYHRMLRILRTAKRTNVSIIKELGIQERLATTARERVLKFFGHVIR